MLKAPWAKRHRLHFFVGSPLSRRDLERVKAGDASTLFIIADFNSPETKKEDKANLLAATALVATFPLVQYRLMLVGLPALHTAVQVFPCRSVSVKHTCNNHRDRDCFRIWT